MKLYYTTSAGQDQIQTDPKLSLGGYKALSPLPNNAFGNLFDEITQFLLSKDVEDEYIGVILENETEEDIENLWLWFDYGTDSYSKLLVAAVDLVADSSGVLRMESIPNKNSAPLYADFFEADGINNAVSIGNIVAGSTIGIWFCRRLVENLATLVDIDSNIYEVDPTNEHVMKSVILEKSDSISICFQYGEAYYGGPIGEELV